ncbi:hypothetical protein EVAR_42414_1 [Eumeta japonica]|uniref:Uncharacterized protein n=1 Tax=Eumeta variegata TaxID=151549 RepID=A0A4C1XAY8_EUMVA|nr:hypothetical protein EVAR_42414_1 [Eumeta japonica]
MESRMPFAKCYATATAVARTRGRAALLGGGGTGAGSGAKHLLIANEAPPRADAARRSDLRPPDRLECALLHFKSRFHNRLFKALQPF